MTNKSESKSVTSENKNKKKACACHEIIKKCQKERDEYLEGWKRIKAEIVNIKKLNDEDIINYRKFAEESLIYELLELIDIFDEATKMEEDEGIMRLRRKMLAILEDHGLTTIDVNHGDELDTKIHESMGGDGDTIDEVIRAGYYIFDRVLRPARVTVKYK